METVRTNYTVLLSLAMLSVTAADSVAAGRLGAQSAPLEALIESMRGARVSEGRLAGGFAYAPLDSSLDGYLLPSHPRFAELVQASATIRRAVSLAATPENLAAVGIVDIIWKKPDDAIKSLLEAMRLSPADVAIRNNLALAYLGRAQSLEEPHDLVRALDLLADIDEESLQEAGFNLALLLEKLYLTEEATKVWRRYLQRDPWSDWGVEARSRLEGSSPPHQLSSDWRETLHRASAAGDLTYIKELVASASEDVRGYAEEELLPSWASAWARSDFGEADRALTTARGIGLVLAVENGDHLVLDTVEAIRSALQTSDTATLSQISSALQNFRGILTRYQSLELGEATALFGDAQQLFARHAIPLEGWVIVYRAIHSNNLGDYETTVRELTELLQRPTTERYPTLSARAHWILGYAHHVQGRPAHAFAQFNAALQEYVTVRETGNAAFMSMLVSESLEFLGRVDEAWRYRHDALKRPSRRRRVILYSVSEMLGNEGLLAPALYFQNAAVEIAQSSKDDVALAEGYWRRSSILSRLGRTKEAAHDLQLATEHAAKIADEAVRNRIESNVALAEAEHRFKTAPREAVAFLTKALEAFSKGNYDYFTVELLAARARAHLSLGETAAAEADLESAIGAVERQRGSIGQDAMKVSYLDKVEALFEDMVLLQLQRDEIARALDYVERSRSRWLLDHLDAPDGQGTARAAARPLGVDSVRERLPRDTRLVVYKVLQGRLLTWIVSRDGLQLFSQAVDEAVLESTVSRFRARLEERADDATLRAECRALYDLLMAPLEAIAAVGEPVVVLPDKFLHFVPFGALCTPEGEYVVEKRPVGVAASASSFVRAVERRRNQNATVESSLVVVNPDFDEALFGRLPSLQSAELEGKQIAALYRESQLLTGPAATKAAFLEHAGAADVVHFGGHVLAHPRFPELSQMVLTPSSADDPGVLLSRELYGVTFGRTRLAVLSACKSAAGKLSPTEGLTGLAQAFLAAGVPSVVATLWDIEDESAAQFFVRFHALLRSGKEPIDALRSVQREFIRSTDRRLSSPASWAAYVHFGGLERPALGPLESPEFVPAFINVIRRLP
jgi:CHAT domain-containing protein